jgi:uncharacterized protein (TIGR02996 family)
MAKKKPTGHDRAFLEDILAHPGDDTPRLIYADWLSDNGGPDRAEFIRLQCRLAGVGELDHERLELEQRETELLVLNQESWRKAVPAWATGYPCRYRRGLLHTVSVTALQFLRDGAKLFAAAPVEQARVRSVKNWAALAASPLLARLSCLDLEWNFLSAPSLRKLLASPHLGGLRGLLLSKCLHTTDEVRELARWEGLPRLHRLDLSGNRSLESDATAALADAPLGSLTWLSFSGAAGVSRLPARAPRLEHLDLSFAVVQDAACVGRLAEAAPALTSLEIDAREGPVQAMLGSPLPGRLESLVLDWNELGPETLGRVFRPPAEGRLRRLMVRFGSAAEALAGGVSVPVERLELPTTKLGSEAVAGLAASPALAGLRWLDLSGNRFGDEGARALALSPHLRELRWLGLSDCAIGDEGAAALASSPNLANLRHLAIDTVGALGPKGVAALAGSPHLGQLRVLVLNYSYSKAEGVRAVLRSTHLGELRRLQFEGGLGAGAEIQGMLSAELADPRHLPRLLVVGDTRRGASVAGYRRAE